MDGKTKELDKGAGALLWACTYTAYYMERDSRVKQKLLDTSRKYFGYAPKGNLRDVAVNAKHT